jgi:hypothetical protein
MFGLCFSFAYRILFVEWAIAIAIPTAVILGGLGLTFSGWLLKRKRMV